MKLHELKPLPASINRKRRIGRGQGSGKGGTATKGHKGAQSRAGYKQKRGFEGGQTPLQRRLPKRGFRPYKRVVYKTIGLDRLQAVAVRANRSILTPDELVRQGVLPKGARCKILFTPGLTKSIEVTAHACSLQAAEAIKEQKGRLTLITSP